MSPAPSSTPSNANTTPAIGCSATKNHHACGISASTPASEVNTLGSTPATAAKTIPSSTPNTSPYRVICQANRRALTRSPAPSAAPTMDWAAIARESSTSASAVHSWSTTWCAPTAAMDVRAATEAAETKQAWNARLRSTRSRPRPSWARISAGTGRSATCSTDSARKNSTADTTCATTFAIADPSSPHPAQ